MVNPNNSFLPALSIAGIFLLLSVQRDLPAEGMKCTVRALKSFTLRDVQSIIEKGENSANLDNFDNVNHAQTDVQMTREMTTENGCYVTLAFPRKSRPGVRRRIAEAFLASIEKGMNDS